MAVLKSKAKFTEPFVGKREVIVMLSVQGGQATASATELDYDAVHALEQTIVDLTFVADTPQTETQMKTQNSNLTFEKDECAKEYEELGLKELKELIKADRKTEPSNSEKPNNCEKDCFLCKWLGDVDVCGRCRNRNLFAEADTEPTSSKMEQVEPQTCSFSDCDNFKNPDYERCIECKRKQIKLKTEQTEREGE